MLVRLKEKEYFEAVIENDSFNSMLVRLKVKDG